MRDDEPAARITALTGSELCSIKSLLRRYRRLFGHYRNGIAVARASVNGVMILAKHSPASPVYDRPHLGDDRDCDLDRRIRCDIQTDRRIDSLQRCVIFPE